MVRIVDVRRATDEEWDGIWQRCDYATYYHSREWAELWREYTDGRIHKLPIRVSFSDGVDALIPLTYQYYYGKIIKRYGLVGPPSEVHAKYGNWIATDPLSDAHVLLLIEHILRNFSNLVWQLNPYDSFSETIKIESRFTKRKSFQWHVLDLTKGENHILANMKSSCRNKINQGLHNNLVVREAQILDEWRHYYGLYQDTLKRWGKKALFQFTWRFYELLHTTFNKHSKLWLTWYNGLPISGCICFYSNSKICIFQSASLTSHRYLRPVNVEKFAIAKDGIQRGYKWLDFGTAGRNKGLQAFKESFGTDVITRDMIFSWSPLVYYVKKALRR